MYFSIFLCGAGHLKHLKIRSPSKENQEQACGAHGKLISTYKLSLLSPYISYSTEWKIFNIHQYNFSCGEPFFTLVYKYFREKIIAGELIYILFAFVKDPKEKLILSLKREIKLLRTENAYFRQQVIYQNLFTNVKLVLFAWHSETQVKAVV